MVTRALERGTGEVTANGRWASLRGDGHALELDPCDYSTTVLKLNSILYGKEYYAIWIWKKGKPSTAKRTGQSTGGNSFSVRCTEESSCVFWKEATFCSTWGSSTTASKHHFLSSPLHKLIFSGEAVPVHHSEGRTPPWCGVESLGHTKVSAGSAVHRVSSLHVKHCGWTRAWEGQVLPEEKLLGAVHFISKNFKYSAAVGTCKIFKAPDLGFRLFLAATEDESAFVCISSCWADINSRWGWEGRWWWERATPGDLDQWEAAWSCGGDDPLQNVSWVQLNYLLTACAFPHLQESSLGCCFNKQCSLRDDLLTAWAFPHRQESSFGCCFNKSQKRIINITSKISPYIVQAEEKGLIQSDELCRNADVLRPGHSSTHLQEHCLTQGGTWWMYWIKTE